LLPLSRLRERYPDLYERARGKYGGREHVPGLDVPPLGCTWADVLHLTAVHPAQFRQALEELGSQCPRRFYEVDPALLDPVRTVIYRYAHVDPATRFADENWLPFAIEHLDSLRDLPDEAKASYRRELEAGRRPLLFHRVPHILYRGPLELAQLAVLELD